MRQRRAGDADHADHVDVEDPVPLVVVVVVDVPCAPMPALLTRMSIPPSRSAAAATAARTEASSVTSAARARSAARDVGLSRSSTATRAPRAASSCGGRQADAGGAAGHEGPQPVEVRHGHRPSPRSRSAQTFAVGEAVSRRSDSRLHLGAEARARRRDVAPALGSRTGSTKCSCRWSTYSITRSCGAAADRDEVEHRQVLHQLAQPDAAGVRADRDAELRRQQQDREVLVDPGDPAASIWQTSIAPACSSCLKITRFCTCSPVATWIGAIAPRDRRVAEHVVRAGRLLDPPRGRTARARSSRRSPRRRPSAGWRRSRSGCPGRPPRGRARSRRTSSSRSAPTFSLIWVKPSATASRQSRTSFSSS